MNSQEEQLKQLINNTESKRTLSGQHYNKNYFNNTFKPLLELGQYFEKLALERIIKYYNYSNPKLKYNNDNRYDIKINNVKYEVKTDVKAITSNNIFIEFIQNNKPSGITTSKAHFYIIVIPYKIPLFIMIEKLELEFLIVSSQFKFILQPTFKNKFTGGYIFDIQTIIKNSILI